MGKRASLFGFPSKLCVQRSINNRQVLPQKSDSLTSRSSIRGNELVKNSALLAWLGVQVVRSFVRCFNKIMEMQWDNSIAGPSAINHTSCTSIWITHPVSPTLFLLFIFDLQVRQRVSGENKWLKSIGCGCKSTLALKNPSTTPPKAFTAQEFAFLCGSDDELEAEAENDPRLSSEVQW